MRSKTVHNSIISNYKRTSIGYLYRRILEKILTPYHLRQIRTASDSSNDSDETVSLIKQNVFLRALITSLTEYVRESSNFSSNQQSELIQLTKFSNMSELLTYLDYKEYSKLFHFNFLEESRFILNHELYLS